MQADLISLLERHVPYDDIERRHLVRTMEFVGSTRACTSRDTLEGHVTASAWVLSPDRGATLLTHHRKLGRWLQPGGHIDEDVTVQAAALREAREESGMPGLCLLSDALFDVDVHHIPARKGDPAHFHFDLRFLLQAETTAFVVGEESIDLAWVGMATISGADAEESIARMARKTASCLAALPGSSMLERGGRP